MKRNKAIQSALSLVLAATLCVPMTACSTEPAGEAGTQTEEAGAQTEETGAQAEEAGAQTEEAGAQTGAPKRSQRILQLCL